MKIAELEANNGKPTPNKSCCTQDAHLGAVEHSDNDDYYLQYYNRMCGDDQERDYCGFPIASRTAKVININSRREK